MPKKRQMPPFWRRGKPGFKRDIVFLRPEDQPTGERFETLADARAESERSEKLLRSSSLGSRVLAEILQECRAGDYECNQPFCPICARIFRRWFIGELLRVTKGRGPFGSTRCCWRKRRKTIVMILTRRRIGTYCESGLNGLVWARRR